VVRGLLVRLRDDLEDLGDWDEVHELAEQALARGTSARRQRAVALAADVELRRVTESLVAETTGR
jgi:carboxylate-amine ligase